VSNTDSSLRAAVEQMSFTWSVCTAAGIARAFLPLGRKTRNAWKRNPSQGSTHYSGAHEGPSERILQRQSSWTPDFVPKWSQRLPTLWKHLRQIRCRIGIEHHCDMLACFTKPGGNPTPQRNVLTKLNYEFTALLHGTARGTGSKALVLRLPNTSVIFEPSDFPFLMGFWFSSSGYIDSVWVSFYHFL
jgi:hypothetical protein